MQAPNILDHLLVHGHRNFYAIVYAKELCNLIDWLGGTVHPHAGATYECLKMVFKETSPLLDLAMPEEKRRGYQERATESVNRLLSEILKSRKSPSTDELIEGMRGVVGDDLSENLILYLQKRYAISESDLPNDRDDDTEDFSEFLRELERTFKEVCQHPDPTETWIRRKRDQLILSNFTDDETIRSIVHRALEDLYERGLTSDSLDITVLEGLQSVSDQERARYMATWFFAATLFKLMAWGSCIVCILLFLADELIRSPSSEQSAFPPADLKKVYGRY